MIIRYCIGHLRVNGIVPAAHNWRPKNVPWKMSTPIRSMSKLAFVYSRPEAEALTIKFSLAGKTKSLNRPKNEPLERPLARLRQAMSANGNAAKKKKLKAAQGEGAAADASPPATDAGDMPIALLDGAGAPVDEATSNEAAWTQLGRVLRVGADEYTIVVNAPTVERIQLKGYPMAGHPVVPLVKVEHAELQTCRFHWLSKVGDAWQPIEGADSFVYVPRPEDVGRALKVTVTPRTSTGTEGEPAEALTEAPVKPCPAETASTRRGELTPTFLDPPAFRMVSYNLLADQYASTDHALDNLFAFCPREYIAIDYRKQLIAAELLDYRADILMLQEVDAKLYEEYYGPLLEASGYSGAYANKEGKVVEGCALFVRSSRFRIAATEVVGLRKVFRKPFQKVPIPALVPVIKDSSNLEHALQRVTTIGQMAILEPVANDKRPPLCVVNTHLFFHPGAPHIRLMQAATLLEKASVFLTTYAVTTGRRPILVFGGDLNSAHGTGVVEYLATGTISASHRDWVTGSSFKWGHEQEEGEALEVDGASRTCAADTQPLHGAALAHPYSLKAADDLSFAFTNYVKGYQAALDYIWYESPKLRVTRCLDMPDESLVRDTYCPSAVYPSDHLAVVCDMEYV